MARSLRDELLRAGLVTSEQASRAERTRRPSTKSGRGKTADRTHGGAGGRAAKHGLRGRPETPPERSPPVPAAPPGPDPEERVRRLNVEIRRILDTEAEKIEAETDIPFHFARGDRLKRLYVGEEQRRRLTGGELAIVGFRGRHHLVPRAAGERVRELRPEVFVFIAADGDGADESVEGYEGYAVPDELVW